MRRPFVAMLVAALVAALGSGCGAAASAPAGTAAGPAELARLRPVAAGAARLPVTVTGTDGARVTVADTSRLVVLNGGIAETVWSLGLGDRVVGRDVSTTFEEAEDLPVVTNAHDINVEAVLALDPTLVLADDRTGPAESVAQLRSAGVPVLRVPEAWSLEDIGPRTMAIARALGVPDAGRDLAGRTRTEIATASSARGEPLRVAFLYLRGSAGVYLLGGDGSGADSLVEALGHVDVGSDLGLGPFTPLTSEALVAAEPDVILVMEEGLRSVGGVDGLVTLAGVAQSPAGRRRAVVAVEDGLLLGFGPRTPAVLRLLGDAIESLR